MLKLPFTAALLMLSVAVRAETPINIDAQRAAVVQVDDLDLSTPHGRAMLKRRVAGAIEEVCGSYVGVTEPSESDSIDGCRLGAQQSADHQLAMQPTSLRFAVADHR